MTDLTLEQCKNLAKWGLPQELKYGGWYYGYREQTRSWGVVLYTDGYHDEEYYKIPSLEELMEFARGLGWFQVCPHPVDFTSAWQVEGGECGDNFEDTSLTQALYRLIEKVKT